jgi:hypothetical protein
VADVTKFLADDHGRIRRAFHEYRRTPSNLEAALNVCDTLWIHLTLEVELIHPIVWDDLEPAASDAAGAADDQIHRLMETINGLDEKDASLGSQMLALSRAVDQHIAAYNAHVVPLVAGRPDEMELGSKAFARWQQLFEERTPRTWRPMDRLANTGWGGGGKLANSGW